MPDKQNCNKSCFKQKNAAQKTPKRVNWAEEAYITADAETAYFAATQGIDFLLTEPEQPEAAVLLVSEADHSEAAVPVQADAVPAPTIPPVAAAYLDHSEGEEDNQSQVAGVVSAKTPEIHPSAVPDSGEEDHDEEHSGEKEQPRRSRRQGKKICYQPFAQRKSKQKQKSQAKWL